MTRGATTADAGEAAVIKALERSGFTSAILVDAGSLRGAGTKQTLRPEDVVIRDYYRFEGISDPDDMSIVYALEGSDGTRGILVDAFGTYADPEVGAVLDRMRLRKLTATAAENRLVKS